MHIRKQFMSGTLWTAALAIGAAVVVAVMVHRAYVAARESVCGGHLAQLATAVRCYEDAHGELPGSSVGNPPHSWRVLVLPELGYQELYEQYDFTESWDSERNRRVLAQMPDVFTCPNCPNAEYTSYFLAVHKEGRFSIVERNRSRIFWTEPRELDEALANQSSCDPSGSGRCYFDDTGQLDIRREIDNSR